MIEAFTSYIDLAGPAVLAGLGAGATTNVIFGGRDPGRMIMAGGAGVITGMLSAILQVATGAFDAYFPLAAAVGAGSAAGFMMRPR